LGEVRERKDELKGFRADTNNRFEKLEMAVGKLEMAVDRNTEKIGKHQLSTSELGLSDMSLAREIEKVLDLDRRLKIVENIVLPKAS
jgi:hypothetical protein